MVAGDHILEYDKNILRLFRQNVLGIERVKKTKVVENAR